MRIEDNILEQARMADVPAFFEKYNGFTFAHKGNEYRCRQHPSLAVKRDRLSWYWHSKGIGGYGVLDYLTKVEGIPFREAVELVIGLSPTSTQPLLPQKKDKAKVLILPDKKGIPLRLYDYLCKKRGLHGDIVTALVGEGKIFEDWCSNIVFVAHDENKRPRYASLRGTSDSLVFRRDCLGSDKRYGFNMAYSQSPRLYIFESPIDVMSHATLRYFEDGEEDSWKLDNRLSLGGTSDIAIPFFLSRHPSVNELVFCLDNDEAGQQAAAAMVMKYSDKGYRTQIHVPRGKDFNEDLLAFKEGLRAEKAEIERRVKSLPSWSTRLDI